MTTTQSQLAINGGTPVREKPMPARHMFGLEERAAALAIFDEAIATGNAFGYNGAPEQAYEADFAAFMGGGFADGVNGGTTAVFAALGALHLPAGSEVVVPPITDPGGVMPVAMLNCIPVFCDSDPRSYNMGPEQLEQVVTDRTRAIIVAHIAGEPADMDGIMAIAKQHGCYVIEDCAQAHAATFRGRKVGSFGDIAAFSTMSGKHFATAAQGGVVYTRNEELHWHGKRFADRGKPFNLPGASSYVVAGLNLNLNDLSAAVGRVQLRKLPWVVAQRRTVGEGVKQGIAGLQATSIGWQHVDAQSSYWFLRIAVELDKLTVGTTEFCEALNAEGIPCGAHYRHIHCEGAWFRNRKTDWCPWKFAEVDYAYPDTLPNAAAVTDCCFNLSIHENYGEREIQDIINALAKVEAAYLK